ncbi:MAG: restriction endonuclease [Anaerovoracaceae bacterium]
MKNAIMIYLKALLDCFAFATIGTLFIPLIFMFNIVKQVYMGFGYSNEDLFSMTIITLISIFFIIVSIYTITKYYNKLKDKMDEKLKTEMYEINRERILLSEKREQFEKTIEEKEKNISYRENCVENIINENSQTYPWLAEYFAECHYAYDLKKSRYLRNKSHPSIKSADVVKETAKEKRILNKMVKEYEHQLNFYETLFPWLEDFKELPPKEAYEYTTDINTNEYERIKKWLSPEDYKNLPSDKKWQLALNNYVNNPNKTNWQIGIEYERFIGYKYETNGYKIKYEGALKGLEDRGRDIIAIKGDEHLVIQCKRWAKEKTIHEKHIMQLFGSVTILNIETNMNYKGVFITTTKLSAIAKQFAEILNIEVIENCLFEKYPLIKCNISNTGEKIYHLPFDQQYDRIHINTDKGNFYAETTNDAESKGFRHAYKWKGQSES